MGDQLLKGFAEQIQGATQAKQLLRITGSGSKDWLGGELKGAPLSTKDYQGVVSYQPDELVITVKAGTPVKEVESILAEKNSNFHLNPLTSAPMQPLVAWFALDWLAQDV